MKAPEPLIVSWRGRQVRIRHDDLRLGPYTPQNARVRSAIELASDADRLRLALLTALGDRYRSGWPTMGASSGWGAMRG